MAIEVTSSVAIDRPPDEVFAYLADWRNNPTWQQGMRSCVTTSDGPLRVGSTYRQEASMLGRTVHSEFVVEAYEPGRMIRITTTSGSFPITVERRVEAREDGGAIASAHVQGDPSGFFAVASPLLRRMVERSVRGDYTRLKQVLESR